MCNKTRTWGNFQAKSKLHTFFLFSQHRALHFRSLTVAPNIFHTCQFLEFQIKTVASQPLDSAVVALIPALSPKYPLSSDRVKGKVYHHSWLTFFQPQFWCLIPKPLCLPSFQRTANRKGLPNRIPFNVRYIYFKNVLLSSSSAASETITNTPHHTNWKTQWTQIFTPPLTPVRKKPHMSPWVTELMWINSHREWDRARIDNGWWRQSRYYFQGRKKLHYVQSVDKVDGGHQPTRRRPSAYNIQPTQSSLISFKVKCTEFCCWCCSILPKQSVSILDCLDQLDQWNTPFGHLRRQSWDSPSAGQQLLLCLGWMLF